MAANSIGSTVEIANVAPVLRSDLRFSLQRHGEDTCYLIEDEKNSRFYRVGIPEYTFISLLDGTTTVREAMSHTAALLGNDAFTENDAATICKWLIDTQLANTEASGVSGRLVESQQKAAKAKRAQWMNPVIVRIPLLRPDNLVEWCTKRFGWWISWPAFAAWLVVVSLAIHQLILNWSELSSAGSHVFAAGNWLWLAICYCLLKVFHELSHGMACKKFGGHVREAGVVLIALAPIPYVDVTSAWRFPSKWKRIFVSAAGMYTEIFIAALATLVWARSEPGLVRQQAQNVMITASFITLLFNANPLMRFDGYYMLSDYLEIPNLYGLGQHFTRYLGRRYFMGVKARLPQWSFRKSACIKTYGFFAMFWRIFICASILIGVSTMFQGAGVVVAILGAILWVAWPLWQLGVYIVNGNSRERPNLVQFAITGSILCAVVAGVLLMPEPGGVRAPAVVAYEPLHVIRAPHDGFIREVKTTPGARVSRDEQLLVIENDELTVEKAELELKRDQSVFMARQLQNERDIAGAKVEREMKKAIEKQLKERAEQLEKSIVTAPASGEVLTRDIQTLIGSYVREGDALIAIGTESGKELEVAIAQDDLERFEEQAGNEVIVRLKTSGSSTLRCQLGAVDPRASRELPDPSLAAINGGPLAVQPREDQSEDKESWELTDPHFLGKIALTKSQSEELRTGQTTTVYLDAARGSVGECLYRAIADWIEAKIKLARDA